MHLCHILAADGLDDIAFVVRGVEAGPASSLGLAVQGSTTCQRVLRRAKMERKNTEKLFKMKAGEKEEGIT